MIFPTVGWQMATKGTIGILVSPRKKLGEEEKTDTRRLYKEEVQTTGLTVKLLRKALGEKKETRPKEKTRPRTGKTAQAKKVKVRKRVKRHCAACRIILRRGGMK